MYATITLLKASPNLTYKIPSHLEHKLLVGMPVSVPLRKQLVSGYVSELFPSPEKATAFTVRDIEAISRELPPLDSKYMEILRWVSEYYHYPLGEVIKAAIPSQKSPKKKSFYKVSRIGSELSEEERAAFAKRGGKRLRLLEFLETEGETDVIPTELRAAFQWLKKNDYIEVVEKEETFTANSLLTTPNVAPISLNSEQLLAYNSLVEQMDAKAFSTTVLHGVTGSGKTEVYLAAARHSIANKRSVLILVPEIALTPQLLDRVQARLSSPVCVLHSGLTDKERFRHWTMINEGKISVVIGARSSVFAPLKNIGLVIVDEEHECSFKQEDRLRYNARDLAIVVAKRHGAIVVLGSATPSLESFYQVSQGKATLLELRSQHHGSETADIQIVDMKRETKGNFISNLLAKRIADTLEIGKQGILFLNRRGFASWLHCDSCGHVPQCPNCSVSLTYYEKAVALRCHYCGHSERSKDSCDQCGRENLELGAIGTEAVEAELNARFPLARVARIDRDIISKKGELESVLEKVKNHEVDLVVGTQMIAKGHDFPDVHLAAVLNADDSLNIPDFRAGERTYQVLTQVAGRSGRRGTRGIAVIQTFDPDSSYIKFAIAHDFSNFIKFELEMRREHQYPPFVRLARILISSANPSEGKWIAEKIAKHIRDGNNDAITVLGPAPAVIQKLQNRFRWNLLLKSQSPMPLHGLLRTHLKIWRRHVPKSTQLSIDIDPSSLL